MIMLYETCGCLSCRKAKNWLDENGLDYSTKNIQSCRMTIQELKFLFSQCFDIYELISKRSTAVKNFQRTHHKELEDLSFNELLQFLQANPTALKRPIITDGKCLVVGWDEDEITTLLPKYKRTHYPGEISV